MISSTIRETGSVESWDEVSGVWEAKGKSGRASSAVGEGGAGGGGTAGPAEEFSVLRSGFVESLGMSAVISKRGYLHLL